MQGPVISRADSSAVIVWQISVSRERSASLYVPTLTRCVNARPRAASLALAHHCLPFRSSRSGTVLLKSYSVLGTTARPSTCGLSAASLRRWRCVNRFSLAIPRSMRYSESSGEFDRRPNRCSSRSLVLSSVNLLTTESLVRRTRISGQESPIFPTTSRRSRNGPLKISTRRYRIWTRMVSTSCR
jgi:hypothetical protein